MVSGKPLTSTTAQATATDSAIASEPSVELRNLAADPGLNEDRALALLKRADLPADLIEKVSRQAATVKSRKVKVAIVRHLNTPRYVSLALLHQLFTFDLMDIALAPATAGDVKVAAEQALIKRLDKVTYGERLSLARRASGRVAGALLLDAEPRVIHAALDNSRLTEALIVRALTREGSPALVHAVCRHPAWSLRRDIRIALLRNENTPSVRAVEFGRMLPKAQLKEILQSSRLPESIKSRLLEDD